MLDSVNEVSVAHRYARIFYDAPTIDDYYRCVETLYPLLRSSEWANSVTGYYLFRYRTVPHKSYRPPSLRLTYFIHSDNEDAAVRELLGKIQLNVVTEADPDCAKLSSSSTDDVELHFRRFLCVSTQVGMDLIDRDLTHARQLYEGFRANPMYQWGHLREEFMRTATESSSFYRSLPAAEQSEFVKLTEDNFTWSHNFVGVIVDDIP